MANTLSAVTAMVSVKIPTGKARGKRSYHLGPDFLGEQFLHVRERSLFLAKPNT
jgi:hypothetical protein